GQFIAVDLGGYQDDLVGADVERGMAYFYNGDNYDEDVENSVGYENSPPAIGLDFVGGPLAEENDGIDNNCNSIVDEEGERHRMDYSFGFNNVDNSVVGDPSTVQQFYNYLKGNWKNGSLLTYGGDGYNPNDPNAIPAQIMFPGDSDP